MKKTLRLLLILALVLLLLAGGLAWALLRRISPEAPPQEELESYLAESWPLFQLRSWDPGTGSLELDYPLRFSYAQMRKYGATLPELRELPQGNLATLADLKTAVRERTGQSIRSATVYGRTTDGEVAYILRPDGSVEACWDATAEAESAAP